ncbi:hypothetical protein NUSPORA_01432 [Nucleospora cyclopteri]
MYVPMNKQKIKFVFEIKNFFLFSLTAFILKLYLAEYIVFVAFFVKLLFFIIPLTLFYCYKA